MSHELGDQDEVFAGTHELGAEGVAQYVRAERLGRIVTEVGCSMMVGGNILHFTRNIPTAIALETQKGAFAQGVALGMVLLILAMVLNLLLALSRGQSHLKN